MTGQRGLLRGHEESRCGDNSMVLTYRAASFLKKGFGRPQMTSWTADLEMRGHSK